MRGGKQMIRCSWCSRNLDQAYLRECTFTTPCLPPTIQVLLPPSLRPVVTTTIASVASSVPDLSTLVAAVSACPPILAAATNPNTTVTVLAPTNEAFAEVLASLNMTAEALLGNQKLLCNVLSYHIIPQIVPTIAVTGTSMAIATLLPGANVTFMMSK